MLNRVVISLITSGSIYRLHTLSLQTCRPPSVYRSEGSQMSGTTVTTRSPRSRALPAQAQMGKDRKPRDGPSVLNSFRRYLLDGFIHTTHCTRCTEGRRTSPSSRSQRLFHPRPTSSVYSFVGSITGDTTHLWLRDGLARFDCLTENQLST